MSNSRQHHSRENHPHLRPPLSALRSSSGHQNHQSADQPLRFAWNWAQGGRQVAKSRTHACVCMSCEPACTQQPVHPQCDSASVRAEICEPGGALMCVRVHAWRSQALCGVGVGSSGVRGRRHFPERGASGQSLRLWTGFNDSSFQGSSRSSCFWRHPGANSDG